jgi:hypothetical protein
MKMHIVGYEVICGDSKKTGKPYDMSRIYTLIPLSQSERSAGMVSSAYDAPAHVLDKLKGCQFPLLCDVQMQDIQQFGRRMQQVVSISPVVTEQPIRKAA